MTLIETEATFSEEGLNAFGYFRKASLILLLYSSLLTYDGHRITKNLLEEKQPKIKIDEQIIGDARCIGKNLAYYFYKGK